MPQKKQNDWEMNVNQIAKILSKLSCTLKAESWNHIEKRDNERIRPQTAPQSREVVRSLRRRNERVASIIEHKVPYRDLEQKYVETTRFDYEREAQCAGNRPTIIFQHHRPFSYSRNNRNYNPQKGRKTILRQKELSFCIM